MWPLPRKVRFQPDSPRRQPHNLHETHQLPSVQLITPDDGHRRCPKHVEFCDKINFGYLMHLGVYLYEAYHDARSLERKVSSLVLTLGARWRRMVQTSYPDRSLLVPNEKGEVGGVRDCLYSVGRRQNSCCSWEANRSVPTPDPYPVTVPTTLSRLM